MLAVNYMKCIEKKKPRFHNFECQFYDKKIVIRD